LENGDVLLRELASDRTHLFSPAQVRAILEFDLELRRSQVFDSQTTPVPAGYTDFLENWNRAEEVQYRVTEFDPEVVTPEEGPPIPTHLLLPPVVAPSQAGSAPGTNLEDDEVVLFRRMLKNSAERDQRQQEIARLKRLERKDNRERKSVASMRAKAMKASAKRTGSASATG
ncbi:hypothetical protein BD413DRAFT_443214, partial [Trametes elegans]